MTFRTSDCIAIGVSDMAAAEKFYVDVLGFEVGERWDGYVELKTGALKLYLCEDDAPICFEVLVDGVQAATEYLVEHGCEKDDEEGDEVFVTDPYGLRFCVSQSKDS